MNHVFVSSAEQQSQKQLADDLQVQWNVYNAEREHFMRQYGELPSSEWRPEDIRKGRWLGRRVKLLAQLIRRCRSVDSLLTDKLEKLAAIEQACTVHSAAPTLGVTGEAGVPHRSSPTTDSNQDGGMSLVVPRATPVAGATPAVETSISSSGQQQRSSASKTPPGLPAQRKADTMSQHQSPPSTGNPAGCQPTLAAPRNIIQRVVIQEPTAESPEHTEPAFPLSVRMVSTSRDVHTKPAFPLSSLSASTSHNVHRQTSHLSAPGKTTTTQAEPVRPPELERRETFCGMPVDPNLAKLIQSVNTAVPRLPSLSPPRGERAHTTSRSASVNAGIAHHAQKLPLSSLLTPDKAVPDPQPTGVQSDHVSKSTEMERRISNRSQATKVPISDSTSLHDTQHDFNSAKSPLPKPSEAGAASNSPQCTDGMAVDRSSSTTQHIRSGREQEAVKERSGAVTFSTDDPVCQNSLSPASTEPSQSQCVMNSETAEESQDWMHAEHASQAPIYMSRSMANESISVPSSDTTQNESISVPSSDTTQIESSDTTQIESRSVNPRPPGSQVLPARNVQLTTLPSNPTPGLAHAQTGLDSTNKDAFSGTTAHRLPNVPWPSIVNLLQAKLLDAGKDVLSFTIFTVGEMFENFRLTESWNVSCCAQCRVQQVRISTRKKR